MKNFIKFLVEQIVAKPTEVVVEEIKDPQGEFIYNITVSSEDMGVIIGKEGNTIKAIRNLAKTKAIKDNVRISVVLNEIDPQNAQN